MALVRPLSALAACLAAVSATGTSLMAQPLPPARPLLVEQPLPPEIGASAAAAAPVSRARDLYFPIAAAEARARGLPPEIADAVMRVESGYNAGAVGGVGERGLMQVLPSTAAMLGFSGTAIELADPATNIGLGVRYLAGAWKLSGGDVCRALMKYRAGHREERMSALSVEYCRRAKAHLALLGSPYGDGVLPAVDFGSPALGQVAEPAPSAGGAGKTRIARVGGRLVRIMPNRTASTSNRFWAAHASRIRAIEARLKWRKGGIIAGT